MVGAGAHDGPSPIDQNMLSDLCFFFGASKAPPPTDVFLKRTDKPKSESRPGSDTAPVTALQLRITHYEFRILISIPTTPKRLTASSE